MNDTPYPFSLDELALDRLVDGELSAAEYREMLAALDAAPDGWRKVALAFLETQALGGEIAAARAQLDAPNRPLAAAASAAPKSRAGRLALVVAASLLAALGLGYWLRGWTAPRPPAVVNELANSEPTPAAPSHVPAMQPDVPLKQRGKPLGDLTLVVSDPTAGDGELIQVPVYTAGDAAERLANERSSMPADVRQVLERTGYRVEEQRQLVPVDLRDGWQVVLPVEQFRIVPAVQRTY